MFCDWFHQKVKSWKKTLANYLYSDEDMEGKLAANAKTFYFDGKICAEDPAFNAAAKQVIYTASIGEFLKQVNDLNNHVGTYVHSESILTTPEMLFTTITCKYNEDVNNVFKPGAKGLELDSEADSKDSQVADAAQADLGITVTKFKEGITHHKTTTNN